MKPPNQRTCTIEDMLVFAIQNNGKVCSKKTQQLIERVLSQLPWLNNIKTMRWISRHWANEAFHQIQAIGITESLELLTPRPKIPLMEFKRIADVAEAVGLYAQNLNGRVIITRTPLTLAAPESRSLADMPPADRGNSSPVLF